MVEGDVWSTLGLCLGLIFVQSPRFAQTKRLYTAAEVVSKRGTILIQYPSSAQAKKLWNIFTEHARQGMPSHTYGALVPSLLGR